MSSGPAVVGPAFGPAFNPIFKDSLDTRARSVDDKKYYVAELHQPANSLVFRAFVPESFSMSLQNHWEPLFGGAEGAASTTIGKAAQAAGVAVNLKYLTRRIWTGTEPIDFTFNFLLDAYSSTFNDVEKPIRDLAKMGTPSRSKGFLFAPGPDALSDLNRIYLKIGNFMVIDSVIIHNIDYTFYSVADKSDGRYMSADISIHLGTNYTPDIDDINRFFDNAQTGNTSLAEANKSLFKGVGDKIEDGKKYLENSSINTIVNDIGVGLNRLNLDNIN